MLYVGTTLAVLVIVLSFWGGSPVYLGEPFEGWVVDAETRTPLEGVAVLATWVKIGGWLHPSTDGVVMILEAVTDLHGHYAIPGWGPRLRGRGHLLHDDPELLLFKRGYHFGGGVIDVPASPWNIRRRSRGWNGEVIALRPYKGSLEEYARDLEGEYTSGIENYAFGGTCWFRNIPRTLVALELEKRRLEQELHRQLFLTRLEQPEDPKTRVNCGVGSIRAAVKGYLND